MEPAHSANRKKKVNCAVNYQTVKLDRETATWCPALPDGTLGVRVGTKRDEDELWCEEVV